MEEKSEMQTASWEKPTLVIQHDTSLSNAKDNERDREQEGFTTYIKVRQQEKTLRLDSSVTDKNKLLFFFQPGVECKRRVQTTN